MRSVANAPDTQPCSSDWTARASISPLAFAMVREDPLIDRWVIDQLPTQKNHVAMIASGGCTAAALVTHGAIGRLTLVDTSAAQLAITKLKLHLLAHYSAADRMALLGHRCMDPRVRLHILEAAFDQINLPGDFLGPREQLATIGPDKMGRYEQVFAALQAELVDETASIKTLLSLSDPLAQAKIFAPATEAGKALDQALDRVMALPILTRLFGSAATANSVQPFASHFAQRLRQVISTLPANNNPYLWQVLAGRFPPDRSVPWLEEPLATSPAIEIDYVQNTMTSAIEGLNQDLDVLHLSNILDWLTEEEAYATLLLASRALKKGGYIVIRQLNSTLNIPSLTGAFDWLAASTQLHGSDRSFFYRNLFVGRRL